MNPTHIHLWVTHLPVFGALLGGWVLAHGIWTKSDQTKIAAYNVLILSSLGAVIAYLTGESAEETVEKIQGISKHSVEEHEDAALFALIALIILGVSSVAGIFITLKKTSLVTSAAWTVLLIASFSLATAARTAYLGGQIRHTEISSGSPAVQDQGGEKQEDHD